MPAPSENREDYAAMRSAHCYNALFRTHGPIAANFNLHNHVLSCG
jgi:hypothetical protein